jgi:hypothetical protein
MMEARRYVTSILREELVVVENEMDVVSETVEEALIKRPRCRARSRNVL